MWLDRFVAESRLTDSIPADKLEQGLARLFDSAPGDCFGSDGLRRLEDHIRTRRVPSANPRLPFASFHDASVSLARLCYGVCKLLNPSVVLETGVAYGVTSAYILQALEENGAGKLYSVDLPRFASGAESSVGWLVPDSLKHRWDLRIGPARSVLPKIIGEVQTADVFIHDSLHTYAHMKWEFSIALPALRPGGILISDDIEGNRAFEELLSNSSVRSWFAMKQQNKQSVCGALRTIE
jgi:predicted O-methyltransferase YrrM